MWSSRSPCMQMLQSVNNIYRTTVIPGSFSRPFSSTYWTGDAIKTTKQMTRKKLRPNKSSLGGLKFDKILPRHGMRRSTESSEGKIVTAYCVAQEYDLHHVNRILRGHAMQAGSFGSLPCLDEPEVVHLKALLSIPEDASSHTQHSDTTTTGDVFVFSSGTVVSWGVPKSNIESLISDVLLPAAKEPLESNAEEEDLEYVEDSNDDKSSIRDGETIVLGTKDSPIKESNEQSRTLPTRVILAEVAFSSGLARATKLSVIENLVDEYCQSSRAVLSMLNGGPLARLKSRKWVYQRLGQLLDLRAQLNLYSELADDLPDLFWDTKQELGLENYYDQVCKALDVLQRIKILNQKMDYAEEIVRNLRDMRSEIHSSRLEWIIIWLITFEVLHTIWIEVRKSQTIKEQ